MQNYVLTVNGSFPARLCALPKRVRLIADLRPQLPMVLFRASRRRLDRWLAGRTPTWISLEQTTESRGEAPPAYPAQATNGSWGWDRVLTGNHGLGRPFGTGMGVTVYLLD